MNEYSNLEALFDRPKGAVPAGSDRVESAAESVRPVPEPMTVDQLVQDRQFQADAVTWLAQPDPLAEYDNLSRSEGFAPPTDPTYSEALETPEDYARAAMDRLSWFNTNTASFLWDYSQLKDADLDTVGAFSRLYHRYNEAPNEWQHFERGVAQSLVDPFNWVGLSFVGAAVRNGLSKAAIKSHLRGRLANASAAAAPAMAVAGVEAGAMAGSTAAAEEQILARGEGRDYDVRSPLLMAGAGTLFGAGLGAVAAGAPWIGRQLYDQVVSGWRSHVAHSLENTAGVARLSDHMADAVGYGGERLTHAEVAARNPVVFTESAVSADQLTRRLELTAAQSARVTDALGEEPVPVHQVMNHEAVQQVIREKGVDLVRYVEPAGDAETWTTMALDPSRVVNRADGTELYELYGDGAEMMLSAPHALYRASAGADGLKPKRVKIDYTPLRNLSGQEIKVLRANLRRELTSRYANRPVPVETLDGHEVIVNNDGVKRSLSAVSAKYLTESEMELDLITTQHIEEIVANSVLNEGPVKSTKKRPGVVAFWYYDGAVEIDGTDYPVRLVVKELEDGRRFHDHTLFWWKQR